MAKKEFHKGEKYGCWELTKRVPGGGNGSIWITKNSNEEEKIIKLLKKTHPTAKIRFCDEMKIMTENKDVFGVMKITDHSNIDPEEDTLWYVMDKGIEITNQMNLSDPSSIIDSMIMISETLS